MKRGRKGTGAGAVRVNVSVPRDVHERMQQTRGVNWSAVATAAFRLRLDGNPAQEVAEEIRQMRERLAALEALLARGEGE